MKDSSDVDLCRSNIINKSPWDAAKREVVNLLLSSTSCAAGATYTTCMGDHIFRFVKVHVLLTEPGFALGGGALIASTLLLGHASFRSFKALKKTLSAFSDSPKL